MFVQTDASLLRAYARGHYPSFEKLYHRHSENLFNYVFRSLGQYPASEELCQEVWLSVLAKAGTFEPGSAAFKTWLFTIARNKVIDFQRRRINQAHVDVDDLEIPSAALDPEGQVVLAELLAAMDQLPTEQRETFVLQQEGFSNREISQITGVGSETVKSRLRYAKTSLKQQFRGEA
jgi:RNA polymerase sigma-70 factor (ECF subfamily)